MAIVVKGSGEITGISTGGLPDGSVDEDTLAANSVTAAKIVDGTIVDAEVTSLAASKLTGALPAIDGSSLTGITGTTTRVHAFSKNAAGKLIWTHTEGTLSLTDSSGVDNYLDWHIGSSDQVYTVNSDGKLICTYT